ncbi:uncharacterized protein TRAVEDRAFT_73325 [Trametes versicolor FP-101664 SS1]|uniref:uncharacterized protein n=1 Tax=Trametes versicolor (strain FP-101664) TaxID=717944 RepID=UPI00046246F0|nr:uncharacterized protein TRAVEDRAFT_73325 [Trametes versicolor FP-101664 SS1]EIW57074.1 hypothetical protein TRAVEDRAFT_73325 [Trametes versicolor FP-101664 SS1]
MVIQKNAVAFKDTQQAGSRLLSSDSASDILPNLIDISRASEPASTNKELVFDVRTLQCEKLTPDDHISLEANRRGINVRLCGALSLQLAPSHTHSSPIPLTSNARKIRLLPGASLEEFPAGLKGFLYYWSPPSRITPLAGEVRFRTTSRADPSSFTKGVDYHLPMGVVWRIPLLTIASTEAYEPLQNVLLSEHLVTAGILARARTLGEEYKLQRNMSRVVHSFYQPFIVDLCQHTHTFYFLGPRGLHHSSFWNLCSEKGQDMRHAVQPFEGRLLCCFEPSKHPRNAHTRTVVIRILKALSPVGYAKLYDGPRNMPSPRAGALLCSYSSTAWYENPPKTAPWRLWSVNVDRYHSEMKVLFDHQGVTQRSVLPQRLGPAPEPSARLLEFLTKDM